MAYRPSKIKTYRVWYKPKNKDTESCLIYAKTKKAAKESLNTVYPHAHIGMITEV